MRNWRWVLEGNGPLKVLCQATDRNQKFQKEGSSYYHFVTGSVADETAENKDSHNEIFVKIGLCVGCFNAGPAGFMCVECVSAEEEPRRLHYGAIRAPCDTNDPPNVATEIDPLCVVQYMNRGVDRTSALHLATYFGPAAALEGQVDNKCYFVWTNEHQQLMEQRAEFVGSRENHRNFPTKRRQKHANNPRTAARRS